MSVDFSKVLGEAPLTIAVATVLVYLGRERSQDGRAVVLYRDVVRSIKGAERTAVRRAVATCGQIGALQILGNPRGGVIIAIKGRAQPTPATPTAPDPAPRARSGEAQMAIPVSTDRALHPDRWTKAESQAGLAYTIEAVLATLYKACKGPRGGEKFKLDTYFNRRAEWRKELLPIVKSMTDRGYTLDHVWSAGAQMSTWKGRTVSFLVGGKKRDGGDQWLTLLEQHRIKGKPPSQSRSQQAALRQRARQGG